MEFYLRFVRETELAICVCDKDGPQGWEAEDIWLPKSKIDIFGKLEKGQILAVEIPGWLAEEKELV